MGRSGEWSWSATWLPIVCNNLIYRVPGIRKKKLSNLLLYRKSCEVWGNNPWRTWNVLTGIRLMTPIRSCIAESTDNRPRDLYWCSSLGMFLVSFLYERRCLRIELLKIKCSLNVPFNIWFLYVLNRKRLFCGTPDATTRKEFFYLLISSWNLCHSDGVLFMPFCALFF